MTGTGAWYEALGVVLESGGEGLVLLHCLEVLSGEEVEEGGEEEDGLVAVGVGDSVDTVVGIEVVEEGVEVELEGGAPLLEVMEVLEAEQEEGVLPIEVKEALEVEKGEVLLSLGAEPGGRGLL